MMATISHCALCCKYEMFLESFLSHMLSGLGFKFNCINYYTYFNFILTAVNDFRPKRYHFIFTLADQGFLQRFACYSS